ncbi:MAG TPA: LuxR C-terminal-related transcriptional regulator [Nocardioides sp.]|nr:LuxR C-terminal-related transcriptional regulator [Nocardioides sp.]
MTLTVVAPSSSRLPTVLSALAEARTRGESTAGLELAARAEELLARPHAGQRESLDGLATALDAHIGALEVNQGRLDHAVFRLAHGAESPVAAPAHRAALADCAGQLALIEAFRGNLELATRHGGVARAIQDMDGSAETGGEHALLASAWVHLERGKDAEAREQVERLPHALPGTREPWLVTARLVAEARLLTVEGRPDSALRLLAGWKVALSTGDGGWLDELVAIASAEALIAAGEPDRALALLTPVPQRTAVEVGVLSAIARRDIGDLRGAGAALAAASVGIAASPLGFQVQAWVLEAQLAQGDGRSDRARLLVGRALRAAAAEELRRPLANERVWLRTFVERDPTLKWEHRTFVASLRAGSVPAPTRAAVDGSPDGLIETLTQRETQVLELLAEMYSTEEIAEELFLSVNTVKTHIKGLFRKLDVNRRNAAVRRGRELGLC